MMAPHAPQDLHQEHHSPTLEVPMIHHPTQELPAVHLEHPHPPLGRMDFGRNDQQNETETAASIKTLKDLRNAEPEGQCNLEAGLNQNAIETFLRDCVYKMPTSAKSQINLVHVIEKHFINQQTLPRENDAHLLAPSFAHMIKLYWNCLASSRQNNCLCLSLKINNAH